MRQSAEECGMAVVHDSARMARVPAIGRAVPRRDGRAKVTGQARYIDDLTLPGMLHGVTVRSPVAARHHSTTSSSSPAFPGTRSPSSPPPTSPGRNVVALILDDQPYLADDRVNHAEEPILLLAHPDKQLLEEARRLVPVRDRAAPPRFHHGGRACARTPVIWGDDNLFKSYLVGRGDVERGLRRARRSSSRGTTKPARRSSCISNPTACSRSRITNRGVTVWGSMQCPYYIHKALAGLFGSAAEKIRVVQMETGGGFGGKEEYPSIIAGHAALLAWKSGRPVKLIYDRAEDMVATTKRHPVADAAPDGAVSRTDGCSRMDIDFVIDGGAYCTLSPVVLSRGTIHASGPYYCSERPDPRPRGRDQRPAAWRVPRIRRAAEHLCARTPHGPRRRRRPASRQRSCVAATSSARADERGRPGDAGPGRHGRDPRAGAGARPASTTKRARFAAANALGRTFAGASALRPSCTAPASPARAKITSRRS